MRQTLNFSIADRVYPHTIPSNPRRRHSRGRRGVAHFDAIELAAEQREFEATRVEDDYHTKKMLSLARERRKLEQADLASYRLRGFKGKGFQQLHGTERIKAMEKSAREHRTATGTQSYVFPGSAAFAAASRGVGTRKKVHGWERKTKRFTRRQVESDKYDWRALLGRYQRKGIEFIMEIPVSILRKRMEEDITPMERAMIQQLLIRAGIRPDPGPMTEIELLKSGIEPNPGPKCVCTDMLVLAEGYVAKKGGNKGCRYMRMEYRCELCQVVVKHLTKSTKHYHTCLHPDDKGNFRKINKVEDDAIFSGVLVGELPRVLSARMTAAHEDESSERVDKGKAPDPADALMQPGTSASHAAAPSTQQGQHEDIDQDPLKIYESRPPPQPSDTAPSAPSIEVLPVSDDSRGPPAILPGMVIPSAPPMHMALPVTSAIPVALPAFPPAPQVLGPPPILPVAPGGGPHPPAGGGGQPPVIPPGGPPAPPGNAPNPPPPNQPGGPAQEGRVTMPIRLDGLDLTREVIEKVAAEFTGELDDFEIRDVTQTYDQERRICSSRGVVELKQDMRVVSLDLHYKHCNKYTVKLLSLALILFILGSAVVANEFYYNLTFNDYNVFAYQCAIRNAFLYPKDSKLDYWSQIIQDWNDPNQGEPAFLFGLKYLDNCQWKYFWGNRLPFFRDFLESRQHYLFYTCYSICAFVLCFTLVHYIYFKDETLRHVCFVPHWVTTVINDLGPGQDPLTIKSNISAYMRRCACLPIRDDSHYLLQKGSELIIYHVYFSTNESLFSIEAGCVTR